MYIRDVPFVTAIALWLGKVLLPRAYRTFASAAPATHSGRRSGRNLQARGIECPPGQRAMAVTKGTSLALVNPVALGN